MGYQVCHGYSNLISVHIETSVDVNVDQFGHVTEFLFNLVIMEVFGGTLRTAAGKLEDGGREVCKDLICLHER